MDRPYFWKVGAMHGAPASSVSPSLIYVDREMCSLYLKIHQNTPKSIQTHWRNLQLQRSLDTLAKLRQKQERKISPKNEYKEGKNVGTEGDSTTHLPIFLSSLPHRAYEITNKRLISDKAVSVKRAELMEPAPEFKQSIKDGTIRRLMKSRKRTLQHSGVQTSGAH